MNEIVRLMIEQARKLNIHYGIDEETGIHELIASNGEAMIALIYDTDDDEMVVFGVTTDGEGLFFYQGEGDISIVENFNPEDYKDE